MHVALGHMHICLPVGLFGWHVYLLMARWAKSYITSPLLCCRRRNCHRFLSLAMCHQSLPGKNSFWSYEADAITQEGPGRPATAVSKASRTTRVGGAA